MTEWMARAVGTLSGGRIVHCDTHAPPHDRRPIIVESPRSEFRAMVVFDAYAYSDTVGYCTGDDDVSRTLISRGRWEPRTTFRFVEALESAPGAGAVLDIGAHVGWYTAIAMDYARHVLAVNACPEHYEVCTMNAKAASGGSLHQALCWVDGQTRPLDPTNAPQFAVVKIDIEGNEQHALRVIKPLIEAGKVENVIMEVSPVFNKSYPDMVREMFDLGYNARVIDPDGHFTRDQTDEVLESFDQADVLFWRA